MTAPVPLPPASRSWTAPPAPGGDPAAVRALAAGVRALAGEMRSGGAASVAAHPSSWTGPSSCAAQEVLAELRNHVEQAALGLEEAAANLDAFATRLEESAHRHASLLHRLKLIGAVVAVTAAAVTVTVATGGATAPEAAAVAVDVTTTAVGEMEAAAAEAAVSESSLVSKLAWLRLKNLPLLGKFLRPQLVMTEAFTGLDVAEQVATTGRVNVARTAADSAFDLCLPQLGRWGALRNLDRLERWSAIPLRAQYFLAPHVLTGVGTGAWEAAREAVIDRRVSEVAVGEQALVGGVSDGLASHAAPVAVRAARGFRDVRTLPALPSVAGEIQPGVVYRAGPDTPLLHSQNSVNDYLKRKEQMRFGWDPRKQPLDVVVNDRGGYTSLDNRRLLATKDWKIPARVVVHQPAEPLPPDQLGRQFGKKKSAQTWGEALAGRIGGQNKEWRSDNLVGAATIDVKQIHYLPKPKEAPAGPRPN